MIARSRCSREGRIFRIWEGGATPAWMFSTRQVRVLAPSNSPPRQFSPPHSRQSSSSRLPASHHEISQSESYKQHQSLTNSIPCSCQHSFHVAFQERALCHLRDLFWIPPFPSLKLTIAETEFWRTSCWFQTDTFTQKPALSAWMRIVKEASMHQDDNA